MLSPSTNDVHTEDPDSDMQHIDKGVTNHEAWDETSCEHYLFDLKCIVEYHCRMDVQKCVSDPHPAVCPLLCSSGYLCMSPPVCVRRSQVRCDELQSNNAL